MADFAALSLYVITALRSRMIDVKTRSNCA